MSLGAVLAVVLYLVPAAVLVLARSRRDRASWEVALDMPLAVAADLLLVLLVARAITFEAAVLASRVAWIAAGGLAAGARRVRSHALAWPAAFDLGTVGACAAAAAAGACVSLWISRDAAVWDRELHVTLVSSLRGQTLPLANPFQPSEALHYHFAGDALASMFQVLSFDRLNAAHALSLSHDVLFALLAATVALLARDLARLGWAASALAGVAPLLSGPVWLRGGLGRAFYGWTYRSLAEVSFRPHVALSALLVVGIAASAVVRLRRSPPPSRTVPALLCCTGLAAIADEASVGLAGFALAASWLVAPDIVHPRRIAGIALLAAMPLVVFVVNRIFQGALAPGGPVTAIKWSSEARLAGFEQATIPLSAPHAKLFLCLDSFGALAGTAGFLIALLARGCRRPLAAVAVCCAALTATSLVLVTHLDINGAPHELQRFMTAPSVTVPTVAMLWLDRPPPGSLARAAIAASAALPAFCSLAWLVEASPAIPKDAMYGRARGSLYGMNCREEAGARVGDRPSPAYVDSSLWFAYVGCRPSLVAGRTTTTWNMRLWQLEGPAAIDQLDREQLAPGAVLAAHCPSRPKDADPVCRRAMAEGRCEPEGSLFLRCELSAQARADLVAGH